MTFCAHDLLYIFAFVVFMWGTTALFHLDPERFNQFIKLLMTAGAFGITTSWLIGYVYPHTRPIREYPQVKQLLKPFGTWKSFPSDHTIGSFTLAIITWLVGAPMWFGIAGLCTAFLISISRVYVGVHYPRDVVGGIAIASIFSFSSFWLLENITQPLYDVFEMLFL